MQQTFIDDIQSQVSRLLATQLDGEFKVISYPSGFNYGITYGNNAYFNQATLQDIDTLLGVASNGMMDLTGASFSTLYTQIMPGVTFSFSQQDSARMDKQETAASSQVTSIVTEFANAGGTFSNPLPFGGRLQDVFNQLNKQWGALDKLPDGLSALRNAIGSYKSAAGDSYALRNRYYAATARIAASLDNTLHPSTTNGGMEVDASHCYVGYTPNKLPSANQLLGSLNTVDNAVSVQINLSSFKSDASDLSISGSTDFTIPLADVLGISVNGSESYDLSRYTSSLSDVTIDITYPGVTMFPSLPSALSADNTTGWYANDILQEVAVKTGQDATGYKLQGTEYDIEQLFGPGKAFSRLKTFVISQQPTITLTFTGANESRITSDLEVGASMSLSLFDLFELGSVSGSYSVKSVDTASSSGTVTVAFGPPQVSGTIPLQQQVAYVMGGVAAYPPDNL
ncbi:hypothetical protein [Streptomyces sioyaensis]|uniref:hypothetical protein n=1 Tax=Streptomyces sioyaensis TaxID=67364 RepID=UPI0037A110BC